MKKILTLITNGFEEIELCAPFDLLVRAENEIKIAALATKNSKKVRGKSGLEISADFTLEELAGTTNFEKLAEDFDALFIPGGPGVWPLLEDGNAEKIAAEFAKKGKFIAAICAAPLILNAAKLLENKRISAHFCTWSELPSANLCPAVVRDGNLLTGRGPGAAFAFGIAFVEALNGNAVAEKISAETMA